MKADLYVQGHFWASIDVPGDSLLALLAKGMISEANRKAQQLANELNDLDQVQCSISLRIKDPVSFTPDTDDHLDAFTPDSPEP